MHGGVWPLITQKPVNRPRWWKGKFALSLMLATGRGEGGRHLSKGRLPHPWEAGGESFYKQSGERATCRNGTVISNSRLQIGHQWSDWHHLGCLDTVHRQFRVRLFPFVCGRFSELRQLVSWAPSGSHAVSSSTWYFGVSKTAPGMWRRVLSTDLEKELKVLRMFNDYIVTCLL